MQVTDENSSRCTGARRNDEGGKLVNWRKCESTDELDLLEERRPCNAHAMVVTRSPA